MSRETDNPSPTPRGWADPQRSTGEDAGRDTEGNAARPAAAARPGAPQPEERQPESVVETTVTRARISIPGSRPIPPIVVREPVDSSARGSAHPAPPAEKTPDGNGTGATGGVREAGADNPSRPQPTRSTQGTQAKTPKKTSSWFEPRKPPRPSQAGTDTQAPPPAPAESGSGGKPPRPPADTPPDGTPDVSEWFASGSDATPPDGTPAAAPPHPASGPEATPPDGTPAVGLPGLTSPLPEPTASPGATPGPDAPSGPTTGPATGEMTLPGQPPEEPAATTMDLGGPFPPAPPPGHAQRDAASTGPLPVPPPGPQPSEAGEEPEPDDGPEPEAGSGSATAGSSAPASGGGRAGRSRLKLVLLGVAGILVVGYGAGLYLSPQDVPKGTTVLGVDIGGLSSDEARSRLDSSLESANQDPLTLLLGDREVELKPSVAGLAVDTEATVQAVSGQDYSPLSVYGSLFGAERTEEAVFEVDREKLTVALEDIAAEAGTGPVEGGITFTPEGPIAQVGQPGTTVDVEAAADAVESAFRERAETGRNPTVELPMTEQEPEITEAEVERAMEEFAEPAMSGLVTVYAGDASISFSPEYSLYQFLGMEPVDGRLVDTYDLEVLEELYGSTFDGVLIERGDGSRTPVQPEDVAGVLSQILRETDPEQRVGYIDLAPD